MKEECPEPNCLVPNGKCHLGDNQQTCENWLKRKPVVERKNIFASSSSPENNNLDWTGLAFGLKDLEIVAVRNRLKIFGVIGPYNAGKTTLLSILFAYLNQGNTFGNSQFAGSFTLEGWENIGNNLKWKDSSPPEFPPHTELTGERVPSLLHLAFRGKLNRLLDVIFTDAPGEWFKKWSINEESDESQGARWMADHSSAFVLVMDCAALVGSERGLRRKEYENLINRLETVISNRPIAVVWTKYNQSLDEDKLTIIKNHLYQRLKNIKEFKVNVCEDGQENIATISEFARFFSWINDISFKDSKECLDYSTNATNSGEAFLLSFTKLLQNKGRV